MAPKKVATKTSSTSTKGSTQKEEAQKCLGDVPGQYVFYVNNGQVLKGLYDLAGELDAMDDGTFLHHVNKENNDFANWIEYIVGDKKLAKSIARVKTPATMRKKLLDRIKKLEKIVGSK